MQRVLQVPEPGRILQVNTMSDQNPLRLVTRGGECFQVHDQGQNTPPNRDGVVHFFHVKDLVGSKGTLKVSIFRFGPRDFYASSLAEFDKRIEMVLLNRLRRGFDNGEITFNVPEGATYYRELRLEPSDFQQQASASDEEIRQFIVHTVYWVAYRYGISGYPVQLDSETDLDYLGVSENDARRNQWLLQEEGLPYQSKIPGLGRPTAALVKVYESRKSATVGKEQVFPRGTQYDAFKVIKQILRTATKSILVVDNYLDDSVLDILGALPNQPPVKLLTSKVTTDFGVAVKKFVAQYQRQVDVKLHQKQVHDRVIVVDDIGFYALGASIKDAGSQLFFINKIEDQITISRLRSELQMVWASAQPL